MARIDDAVQHVGAAADRPEDCASDPRHPRGGPARRSGCRPGPRRSVVTPVVPAGTRRRVSPSRSPDEPERASDHDEGGGEVTVDDEGLLPARSGAAAVRIRAGRDSVGREAGPLIEREGQERLARRRTERGARGLLHRIRPSEEHGATAEDGSREQGVGDEIRPQLLERRSPAPRTPDPPLPDRSGRTVPAKPRPAIVRQAFRESRVSSVRIAQRAQVRDRRSIAHERASRLAVSILALRSIETAGDDSDPGARARAWR